RPHHGFDRVGPPVRRHRAACARSRARPHRNLRQPRNGEGSSHLSPRIRLRGRQWIEAGSLRCREGFCGRLSGIRTMAYVVTENCIKCKHMDCVSVCPVDCFYEGENMLVIHPDECIDCGVCEPECPVEAIKPDTAESLESWVVLNRNYSGAWPKITE